MIEDFYIRDNFLRSELVCKCGCDTMNITNDALDKLQAFRELVNVPVVVNSACRCESHNDMVGGMSNSQHLCGDTKQSTAFDIKITDDLPKKMIIHTAKQVGFQGLGVNYNSFVHIDDRGHKARW